MFTVNTGLQERKNKMIFPDGDTAVWRSKKTGLTETESEPSVRILRVVIRQIPYTTGISFKQYHNLSWLCKKVILITMF